ncbi:prolyl oligopeptidase family serine peptidase [Xanthomonas translucens]|uniref:alpha/beta hydrolase family protein n=1 Tax=Xanthomonas campestris pv. translucens TaxID=343 RepID=UPI00272D22F3|nr:prolyl oligopeptidase family serine peptidase [Xanthomonas translucens]WLA13561.1 prolyl oligopeptidase family serine peptidase [Xanthomonas translucens]
MLGIGMGSAQAQVDLAPFLKQEQVGELTLSLTGEQARPCSVSHDPYSRTEVLDVYSGRRRPLVGLPKVRRASFYSDEQVKIRFASGADADNADKLLYRDAQGGDWRLLNDQNLSHHAEWPIGFSENGRTAYLQVQQDKGSDAIVAWNVDSNERKEIARDALADRYRIMYRHGTRIPVGIQVLADKPRSLFFDPTSPQAKIQRSLEAAFAGQAVYVISSTRDGRLNLVQVQSGRNPGEFYLFDTVAKDVTDATRWAIARGIADPARICMYGASYGAYASLMGVAREPSLYRCAAGYVGVYDLPMMYVRGDAQKRDSSQNFLREWMGAGSELAAVSPVNLAGKIKVPVFIAAGGEDETAPIEHFKKMEAALKKAGVPVETLYVPTEGHGFYTEEHRREFYTRRLAFLSRSLCGAQAAPAPAR